MAKPNSIIDLGGKWGDSTAENFERMGLIRRLRDGGYELAGEAALAAPAAAEKKAEAPRPEAEADAVNLDGVEAIPPSIDVVHSNLKRAAGPATYTALLTAAIHGADMSAPIADVARSSGQPIEHVRESVEGVLSEYRRAAGQVFQANGGRSGDGFQAMLQWAQQNGKADQAIEAMMALVERNEVSLLAKMSRSYSRLNRSDWTNSELLSADFGAGVTAREIDGVVYLNVKGRGEATFAKALAHGWIRTSGGGR
jgi:hypothetical protein